MKVQYFTDKENIERYTTEIIADTMKMLGKREKQKEERSHSTASTAVDDDIPF